MSACGLPPRKSTQRWLYLPLPGRIHPLRRCLALDNWHIPNPECSLSTIEKAPNGVPTLPKLSHPAPAQQPPLLIDIAAVDVGYFATKYTVGRDVAKEGAPILARSIPSFCPLIDGVVSAGAGTSALSGVVVEVNGSQFFVGPDSAIRGSGRNARVVSETYADSEQYLALFRGALHYICRELLTPHSTVSKVTVKRMVVGLPLHTLSTKKNSLRSTLEAVHKVPAMPWGGPSLEVDVKSCTVLAQPQGALVHHGASIPHLREQNTLVLDVGGGTFDWFLMHGKKVHYERCGAYPKGTLECAFAVCDRIHKSLRDDAEIVKRVDTALRTRAGSVLISGKQVQMAPFEPVVLAILKECVDRMLQSVQSLASVDLILFTGGGARRLYELMTVMFPERQDTMQLDGDPVFSNVYGFHALGEKMNDAKTS